MSAKKKNAREKIDKMAENGFQGQLFLHAEKENGKVRTTPSTFFGMSNRVQHQKLDQVAARVFGY